MSVLVSMVRIRHMRVHMHYRLVYVGMAVRAYRHGIVRVVMVAVAVAVCVLVFQPLMCMLVSVRLRQVQHYPQHHQQAPTAMIHVPLRSPRAMAIAAPMKGANANTDPVRAAPKARWASR